VTDLITAALEEGGNKNNNSSNTHGGESAKPILLPSFYVLKRVAQALDLDGDGRVSFPEFRAAGAAAASAAAALEHRVGGHYEEHRVGHDQESERHGGGFYGYE
jgi:hypothetical protein